MRCCTLIATVIGVAASASTVALAADAESLPGDGARGRVQAIQCLKDLQAFDNELADVGFGILPPTGYSAATPYSSYAWGGEGTPRQQIRSLRDAAYVYAMSGNEQSCQLVLSSMRQVYERHQKVTGSETDNPDASRTWRRAHLSRSKPIVQMNHLMRADVLIGSEIRNLKDEKLGEIRDLVLNPEKRNILYVLVARGGFLGFGEQLVAIPWRDLRATEDHELYVLDVPAKALEAAPKVDRRNFEKTADADWRRSLSAYWDKALKR